MEKHVNSSKPHLSPKSSFFVRLNAYLHERFPLFGHGILIVSYYSSNQFLAQTLELPGQPVRYELHSLMGAITVFCIFFHLRVFDEHKDYEDDCVHYPDRVLSRGLITLRHLKLLGGGAIVIELVLAAWRGPAALTAVLAALGFSFLMLKEFFVSSWLKKHFLLYATTHMLIMPFLALVAYSFTTQNLPWNAPPLFWVYAFVGFFVTFNWEISRKIRVPQDEKSGVQSYSKLFGMFGAAYAVILIRMIDTAMVSTVGFQLGLSPWFYAILVGLFFVCLIGLWQFKTNPCRTTANRMETYAGMYIIAFDITLAVAIIHKVGIIV